MKRLILGVTMLLAASWCYGGSVFESVKDSVRLEHKPIPRNMKGPKKDFSPEKMAEKRAENMARDLGLSDSQKEKVLALFKEDAKNTEQLNQQERKEKDKKRDEMKERKEKLDQSLKEILTEGQYKKYLERKNAGKRTHRPRMMARPETETNE